MDSPARTSSQKAALKSRVPSTRATFVAAAVKKFSKVAWPDAEQFRVRSCLTSCFLVILLWFLVRDLDCDCSGKVETPAIGYCCDGDERLLVAEFMPNDTLAIAKHRCMFCSPLYFLFLIWFCADSLSFLFDALGLNLCLKSSCKDWWARDGPCRPHHSYTFVPVALFLSIRNNW